MTLVDADNTCPHDPAFVHRFYFGCVPHNFSETTGKAKGFSQSAIKHPDGHDYWIDAGWGMT